jgi:trigger factor
MQVKKTHHSDTSLTLTIVAAQADLGPIKQQAVQRLGKDLKLQGFRPGKAPQSLIEKNLDPAQLQTEIIEEAINRFYAQALGEYRLRPVMRPDVAIKKFVPFDTLEFDAKVDVVGEIKLPDYKKIKKAMPKVSVTAKDVDEVIEAVRKQSAEKKDVDRAAKDGDQVWIDFKGVDAKGEPVPGADGKNYPLDLGSDTFIPGFEKNLIGVKANEEKTFTLTFPKDYGVKALASKKVTFTVTITKVQEIVLPKVDDSLAKKAGPFKDVQQLKDDIKTELTREREQQAVRDLQQELIQEIAAKAKVGIPEVLITEQTEAMLREHKQNLVYRGQTIEEFLKAEGKTEEEYRDKVLRPAATERVKAGLVLSEIAEAEKLEVEPEELQKHVQELKLQYHQDAQMQAELDKPENMRDLAMRLLTEKTVNKLVEYAT